MEQIKVIPRRDKEEVWEQFNPILGEQELVKVFCENEEERFKIGDGKTTYRNLPFVEGNKRHTLGQIRHSSFDRGRFRENEVDETFGRSSEKEIFLQRQICSI